MEVWTLTLFADVAMNLNTVKLKNGKSLKTRRTILLEYLRKQIFLDLIVASYVVFENLQVRE